MLLKELFKKVETLNNLNKELGIGVNEIEVHYDESDGCSRTHCATFKEFKKWVKEEYIKNCHEPILNAELKGEEGLYKATIAYFDLFGKHYFSIEIRVY